MPERYFCDYCGELISETTKKRVRIFKGVGRSYAHLKCTVAQKMNCSDKNNVDFLYCDISEERIKFFGLEGIKTYKWEIYKCIVHFKRFILPLVFVLNSILLKIEIENGSNFSFLLFWRKNFRENLSEFSENIRSSFFIADIILNRVLFPKKKISMSLRSYLIFFEQSLKDFKNYTEYILCSIILEVLLDSLEYEDLKNQKVTRNLFLAKNRSEEISRINQNEIIWYLIDIYYFKAFDYFNFNMWRRLLGLSLIIIPSPYLLSTLKKYITGKEMHFIEKNYRINLVKVEKLRDENKIYNFLKSR